MQCSIVHAHTASQCEHTEKSAFCTFSDCKVTIFLPYSVLFAPRKCFFCPSFYNKMPFLVIFNSQ